MKKAAIRRVFALVLTWMMLLPSFTPSVLMESLDLDDELQIDLGGEELELPSDDLVLDGIGDGSEMTCPPDYSILRGVFFYAILRAQEGGDNHGNSDGRYV